ncbi:lysosome membrane protein 2-like [Macrobrachium rosenbergii]|uniref:lysosome membrane protein 2-like n=1 Tax=Macrobrachium rosenbergii TaxID=79674 RepID=UPI0034D6FAD8
MQIQVKVGILVVVGILLIVGSIIFQMQFDKMFDKILSSKLVLQPGSKTLESFKSPPVPIFMQFYFFNVTNKDDVVDKGAKPVLQQVGPYTYAEKQLKYDLSFDDEAGTVTYLQNKSFVFRPELSGGLTENDKITTVNAVMMSVGVKFATLPDAVKAIVEILFKRFQIEPFITKPVGELLFHGYDEPFLAQLGKLTKKPEHLRGKFGFFYPKNNTHGGYYTIKSGVQGMEDYQDIVSWKGKPVVDFWKEDMWGGNTCNMINGTSGNQFARPVSKHKRLDLYTAELCRSIFAVFQKEVTHGPMTLYRYVLPDYLLADTPDNECYCVDDFTCRASMIDVSPCREGAPVVMSTPHFYQGSSQDLTYVEGLNPIQEEHETYLDIEPNTGVTFRAAKRIQLNMVLRPYSEIPSFGNVPEVILPVLWVNESAVVPLERAYALHRTLNLPFTLVKVATGVLVALGVVLILAGLIKLGLLMRHKHRLKKSPTANNRAQNDKEKEKHTVLSEKLNSANYS